MSGKLKDKVAIVTGGGRGIGEAIGRRFAREGAAVVIAQRTLEEAERVAGGIQAEGGSALAVSTDITISGSVGAMVKETLTAYGRLDILCNNAGRGGVEDLVDMTSEHYNEVMEPNVRGVLLCMRYGIPPMLDVGGGSVINIASITSFVGIPRSAIYCASKGAVLALTRQAALDFGPQGIRVNAIAPGYIGNQMFYEYCAAHMDPEAAMEDVLSTIPLGRLGTSEDIAGAALYFASDDASWVTGATLVVDGGILCH